MRGGKKDGGLTLIADRPSKAMTVYDRAIAVLWLTMREGETDDAWLLSRLRGRAE